MKHRSDKFLRQDLLFPCIFDGITRQCVNAELNSLDLLFKERHCDKEAVKVQLMIYRLKRDYKLKSKNKAQDILLDYISYNVMQYCKDYINSQKRLEKLLRGTFNEINIIFLKHKLTPDKLILISLKIVELANEDEIEFPPFIEKMFNVFLEIEYLHNISKSEYEFQIMKKSADKQAVKIYEEFKKRKYFLKKGVDK